MQTISDTWAGAMTATKREIVGKAELYNGSALSATFMPTDDLISIEIERKCTDGKFFGYAVLQAVTVKIFDSTRAKDIGEGQILKCYIGYQGATAPEYVSFPQFTIYSVERDETDNSLTIKGWDAMHQLANTKYSSVSIIAPFTLEAFANKLAEYVGITVEWKNASTLRNINYTATTLPNLDGKENLRELVAAIAEVTGTIAYINSDNKLFFKTIDRENPVLQISKNDYFEFTAQKAYGALGIIEHDTELGDNTVVGTSGTRQIIQNNPFIENRDDIQTILTSTLAVNAGMTIYPYKIEWRGNPALELGDYISIQTKDNNYLNTYFLGETLTYDANGLVSKNEWSRSAETYGKKQSITEAIRDTSAKVDRVNSEIVLLAKKTETSEKKLSDNIGQVATNLQTVSNQMSEKITPEQAQLIAKQVVDDGVTNITTETGFTFDKNGLTVNKSGTPMTTLIDEDGMTVKRDSTEVLNADSTGVNAINLTARQYFIIGHARFENYGSGRTGCFYI